MLRANLLVQPPSESPPSTIWTPSPVLHVRFTTPFLNRSSLTARASLTNWGGQPIKTNLTTLGPYFAVPKTPPPIYAPAEWDAYFCWEDLSVPEAGSYRLRVEVECLGAGRDVVESRFVLVWWGGGGERMENPSVDELKTLKRLEKEVGKGPFTRVKYTKTGGPSWWLTL